MNRLEYNSTYARFAMTKEERANGTVYVTNGVYVMIADSIKIDY